MKLITDFSKTAIKKSKYKYLVHFYISVREDKIFQCMIYIEKCMKNIAIKMLKFISERSLY